MQILPSVRFGNARLVLATALLSCSLAGCLFDGKGDVAAASSMPAATELASAQAAASQAWWRDAHSRAAREGQPSGSFNTF